MMPPPRSLLAANTFCKLDRRCICYTPAPKIPCKCAFHAKLENTVLDRCEHLSELLAWKILQ